MPKAIYRPEYKALLTILRRRRAVAGLTQTECSDAMGRPQSFMSDVERGSRRLDVVQLRDLCAVLGCSLGDVITEFEEAITAMDGPPE